MDEIRACLERAGLEAISAHVPIDEFENDLDKTVQTYCADMQPGPHRQLWASTNQALFLAPPKELYHRTHPTDNRPPALFEIQNDGCGITEVDAQAIVPAAIESGAQWLVIEQDTHTYGTPMENMKKSLEFIKNCMNHD